MNVKKAAANILSYALVGASAFWMVQALTSENDTAKAEGNTDEQGNVDIVLNEYERLSDGSRGEFIQHQNIFPASYQGKLTIGTDGFWNNVTGAIDKIVEVDSVGGDDAYYRVVIAVEHTETKDLILLNLNDKDFSWSTAAENVMITTDEGTEDYDLLVGVYTSNEGTLKPDDTPVSSLREVAISADATNDSVKEIGEELNILVFAQACQVGHFGNNPKTALDTAFNGAISETNHPWLETKQ